MMVVIFSITIEAVVCGVFLILSIKELIRTYRNPYPTFNEHEEKKLEPLLRSIRIKE